VLASAVLAVLLVRAAAPAARALSGTGVPEALLRFSLGAADFPADAAVSLLRLETSARGDISPVYLSAPSAAAGNGGDAAAAVSGAEAETSSSAAVSQAPASQAPASESAVSSEPVPVSAPAAETTITGQDGGYENAADGIYLKNKTGYDDIDVPALLAAPSPIPAGARVLIIHTHGSESYAKEAGEDYEESDTARTEDKAYSVIRVGDELEKVLTARGVAVVHDRELYDYPSYAGSYSRSMEAISGYLAQYPDIAAVIDLHRDALISSDGTVYKTVADVGDSPCAQVLLIVGSDWSGLEHPNWRENLSFAVHIQADMVRKYPSLARPLSVSEYRYNQNATPGSLIAEVGCSGNTLSEALRAVTCFGDCLADVLTGAG